MLKSIPTDSQFPPLPKCFEMEFGPQKGRVLVPLYPLLSLSRLGGAGGGCQFFLLVKRGGCKKLCTIWGRSLKIFPI